MSTYGFLPIAGISLLVYIFSYILTKTSYLKVSSHRRRWNLILLVSFLVVGFAAQNDSPSILRAVQLLKVL